MKYCLNFCHPLHFLCCSLQGQSSGGLLATCPRPLLDLRGLPTEGQMEVTSAACSSSPPKAKSTCLCSSAFCHPHGSQPSQSQQGQAWFSQCSCPVPCLLSAFLSLSGLHLIAACPSSPLPPGSLPSGWWPKLISLCLHIPTALPACDMFWHPPILSFYGSLLVLYVCPFF